ncbi:MAG: methionyl-tRNA formyltransferase [Oceanospirillaceae bacterium]|nr:methionyl-tRNA formyltransferase [Oceanospirillaceae bacterium]
MSKSLKIIFAGTPEFAAQNLASLINSQHEVIAVYTQPDRRSGRGKKIKFSAVKEIALTHDIPVYQPTNFKADQDLQQLATLNGDIMVIVAYGLILPQKVLDTPPLGCINVHASLLPRWRGAAPIERSLLAGDSHTGVTIMQMDKGLDTGDMLNSASLEISSEMNSQQLHDCLIPLGSNELIKTINEISMGLHKPVKQDNNLANYAEKLQKTEGVIDWNQSAAAIALKVRGLNPRPVAYSALNELVIRIWAAKEVNVPTDSPYIKVGTIIKADKKGIEVSCLNNTRLLITRLQLPGGKQLEAKVIINAKKELFLPNNQFSSIAD